MPFASTTMVPRVLSAVASTASSAGDDVALSLVAPALPPSSSPPQPLSTRAPRARTVVANVVLRMGSPSVGRLPSAGAGTREHGVRGRAVQSGRASDQAARVVGTGGQDGVMTAPGNGSQRPQHVVV